MPSKDVRRPQFFPAGTNRLIDRCFRQLRYDNINCVIDACYHAMQQLVIQQETQGYHDYQYGLETPCGFRYSLFRKVSFEELLFHDGKGVVLRVSYDCPRSLQGRRMHSCGVLEDGMLVALVGLDKNAGEVDTIFFEVHLRESTEGMRTRTGTHTRGRFHSQIHKPHILLTKSSDSTTLLRG